MLFCTTFISVGTVFFRFVIYLLTLPRVFSPPRRLTFSRNQIPPSFLCVCEAWIFASCPGQRVSHAPRLQRNEAIVPSVLKQTESHIKFLLIPLQNRIVMVFILHFRPSWNLCEYKKVRQGSCFILSKWLVGVSQHHESMIWLCFKGESPYPCELSSEC